MIAYLPAGFPDKPTSIRLIDAMIDAGVDMVEVGIPYSDPVMDGPVICEAAEIALQQGITTDDALDVVAADVGPRGRGPDHVLLEPDRAVRAERFAAESGRPRRSGGHHAGSDAGGGDRLDHGLRRGRVGPRVPGRPRLWSASGCRRSPPLRPGSSTRHR